MGVLVTKVENCSGGTDTGYECDIVDKSELESDMIVTVGEESSSDFEVDIEYNMTNVKTVELVSQFDTDSDKENIISWRNFKLILKRLQKIHQFWP